MNTTTQHTTDTLDFAELWRQAIPWRSYLQPAMKQHGLWDGIYRRVTLPDWAEQRAGRAGRIHLLVIAEDWCGDAANTVPVLAALADALPEWSLRVLPRDEHPAVMDRYLTNGADPSPSPSRSTLISTSSATGDPDQPSCKSG